MILIRSPVAFFFLYFFFAFFLYCDDGQFSFLDTIIFGSTVYFE